MTLPEQTRVLHVAALEYAACGWPVFPLVQGEKFPAIRKAHPSHLLVGNGPCIECLRWEPNPQRQCRGECGQFGHGLYDATTDLQLVDEWWSGAYAGCNIGGRVPDPVMVLDVDPRNRGDQRLAVLEAAHGTLPPTLTTVSGRGDGGHHLFYRRPPGRLTARHLRPGIDLKTSTGYVVLAPSIHPETGQPYRRITRPVAAPPPWLIDLVVERPRCNQRSGGRGVGFVSGCGSVADSFAETHSWTDVLEPHGWECVGGDGEDDGSRWRHPDATAHQSASIRHGLLFVYSTSTAFEATGAGEPHGYTKFRAYAVLDHSGDLRAAARKLSGASR